MLCAKPNVLDANVAHKKALLQRTVWVGAALCSSLLLTSAALAQSTPEPLPQRMQADGNGVDMATGAFTMSVTDVAIGPAGAGGLAYTRVWSGTGWRSTMLGTICVDPGDSTKYVVSMGSGSQIFILDGTDIEADDFDPEFPNGATLEYDTNGTTGNFSDDTFIYTSPDGTQATFTVNLGGLVDPEEADQGVLTKIVAPNGATTEYHYRTETEGTKTRARLQSVTNSYGYQLQFEYVIDTPTTEAQLEGGWLRPKKVIGVNNAVDYCSPTADKCSSSFTIDWPTAEYDGNAAHAALTSVETYFDDAVASRTTTYTYASGKLDKVRYDGFTVDNIDVNYFTSGANDGRVSSVSRGFATWSYSYAENATAYSYTGDTTQGTFTTTINVPGASANEVVVSDLNTGLVEKFTNTDSQSTIYKYNSDERLIEVELPEGNSTEYAYDERGNLQYTTVNPKTGTTKFVTCYEYMEGKTITSCGATPIYGGSAVTDCTTQKTCNKVKKVVNARGEATTFDYASAHGGLLWSKAPDPDGAGSLPAPESRVFYAQKQARFKDSASTFTNGDQVYLPIENAACANSYFPTAYNATASHADNDCYDGDGDKTVTSIEWPGTSVANNLQPVSVKAASALADTHADYVEAESSFTYDDYGRIDYVDGPLPSSEGDDRTRTIYDNLGRFTGTIGPDPDGSGTGNDLKHVATRTLYNALGLVASVEQGTTDGYSDTDWTNFTSLQKADTKYDDYGRPIVSYVYDGATTTIASLSQTKYEANAGRVECAVQRMNPSLFSSIASTPSSYDPCNSPTTTGDFGRDRVSKIVYDATTGRISKTIAAYGTPSEQEVVTTQDFTGNGLVETLADADGNKTHYIYDAFDRVERICYPVKTGTQLTLAQCDSLTTSGDYEVYSYDDADGGLLEKVQPRMGSMESLAANQDDYDITFTYDALGRVTTRHVPGSADGTTAEENFSYTYDNFGRVVTGAHHDLTLTYAYDALGRLTDKQYDHANSTIEYAYDAGGRLETLTHPDAYAVDYEYDALGRPVAVKNGSTSLADIAYDDLGRREEASFGNGTKQTYDFDGMGRLSDLANDLDGATTTNDQTYTFDYNPASQIVEKTATNALFDFAAPAADFTDSYAANGLNQYTDIAGTVSMTYDGSGNLTKDHRGQTYAYDAENRLMEVKNASSAVLAEYAYSSEGLVRQRAQPGTSSLRYFHDGAQEIYETTAAYSGTAAADRRYVRIPGSVDEAFLMIDYVSAGCSSGCEVYAHTDARGSVVATSDDTGAKEDIYTYSVYGEPGEAGGFPFRFTGQRYDEATGLYYYKARWYDPETGRFLQTDPIGYGDGMNMYAYVGNDPVNGRDPSGLKYCTGSHISRPDDANCFEETGARGGSSGGGYNYESAPKDDGGGSIAGHVPSTSSSNDQGDVIVVTGTRSTSYACFNWGCLASGGGASGSTELLLQCLGLNAWHCFIRANGRNGEELIARGGKTGDGDPWERLTNPGNIDGYSGDPLGTPDGLEPVPPSTWVTVELNLPFAVVQDLTQRFANDINAAEIPYKILTQNSNSYAFTLWRVLTGDPAPHYVRATHVAGYNDLCFLSYIRFGSRIPSCRG